jgi:hypothetical protein
MLRCATVIFLALGFPGVTAACSCAESSVTERFELSGIIIAAEAESVRQRRVLDRDVGFLRFPHEQTVTWRVAHVWKGDVEHGATFSTRTRVWRGGCGIRVMRGQSMLLFLHDLSDRQPLRLCSGSRTLAEAIDVIPELFQRADDPGGTSQHPFRRPAGVK